MALSSRTISKLTQQMKRDHGLAQALLDEGLQGFIDGKSVVQNKILEELLVDDFQLLDENDVMVLMAEAKQIIYA